MASGAGDAASVDLGGGSGSGKRKKLIGRGRFSLLSEVPTDLLQLIFNKLGVIKFLMIACVYKSWRAVAIAMRQEFVAAQGPLVFFTTANARKNCYFYSTYETRLYKTALPHLAGNKCVGVTCGYLVLANVRRKAKIWLVNPFARHVLCFPRPPRSYCRVILASLGKPVPEFVAVAFSTEHPFLRFCRSRDPMRTVFNDWRIIDVAVLKLLGEALFLGNANSVGVLTASTNKTYYCKDEKVGLLLGRRRLAAVTRWPQCPFCGG